MNGACHLAGTPHLLLVPDILWQRIRNLRHDPRCGLHLGWDDKTTFCSFERTFDRL